MKRTFVIRALSLAPLVIGVWPLGGCARLHHVSYGEVDAVSGRRFELMVSETGINLQEAASLAKALAPQSKRELGGAQKIGALFQTGPKTGNPVFSDDYADRLYSDLVAVCPSMNITGLRVVRESRAYPIVSGEIVKITGECL